jgi:hypothetical protein
MGDEAWDPALRPLADVGTLSLTVLGPEAEDETEAKPVVVASEIDHEAAHQRGFYGGADDRAA